MKPRRSNSIKNERKVQDPAPDTKSILKKNVQQDRSQQRFTDNEGLIFNKIEPHGVYATKLGEDGAAGEYDKQDDD